MRNTFMNSTDLDYTNAIMDENRDMLFESDNYKKINDEMIILNEKIEQIPEEYREMFSKYDYS